MRVRTAWGAGAQHIGVARVFVNAENLTDVRQTNSLIRPDRGVDGRWTVDARAPVDGRAIKVAHRVLLSMRLSTPPIRGSVCHAFLKGDHNAIDCRRCCSRPCVLVCRLHD
jgi:hypothetical protein